MQTKRQALMPFFPDRHERIRLAESPLFPLLTPFEVSSSLPLSTGRGFWLRLRRRVIFCGSDLTVHEEVRNLRSVRLTIDANSKLFVVLLAVIVMLPSLSIDSCLASLPEIGRSLRAQPAASALILSLFMVGFAVGQMTFGPLCDRFGRRSALLIGCGVFALAAIGCAATPSIQVLVAWRFLQGIGAAAGPVISLAIIRDAFTGSAARKRFAYVGVVATLAPIVAPTLGSFVSSSAGWRAVFCFLAVGGILLILVAGVASSLFGSARMLAGAIWQRSGAADRSLCAGRMPTLPCAQNSSAAQRK